MAGQRGYGQFCPVSRAAEILTERWVPLIVRELCCGSTRFSQLQSGIPRMSPSLLSQRLKQLEQAGIVVRRRPPSGAGWEYLLTQAGQELFPIIEGMGRWAQRWVRDDLVAKENLDPTLLMWDVHRNVALAGIPTAPRYVTRFEFPDMKSAFRRYWLVVDDGEVDLCLKDPGFAMQLSVTARLRRLTEIWLGYVSIDQARRDGTLRLEGETPDIAAFPRWFGLSPFAADGRQPPGRAAGAQ